LPSIESIRFDTAGWRLEETSPELTRWTNDKAQVLTLNYFDVPPDVPSQLTDINGLRQAYRVGLAQVGAALISADVFPASGLDCIMLVFKSPIQSGGMVYVGSVTFPFEEFSYVIKVQCPELGPTGVRDAMVLDMLMQQGAVAFDPETETIVGWMSDPYDRTFQAPLLSNRSDLETFDSLFPEHPLSEVRRHLHLILQSTQADNEVMLSPRFVGPRQPVRIRDEAHLQPKPWWRFW